MDKKEYIAQRRMPDITVTANAGDRSISVAVNGVESYEYITIPVESVEGLYGAMLAAAADVLNGR